MNIKNLLLLFIFFVSTTLVAQNEAPAEFEFGISLLSFTREFESDRVNSYRSGSFGLLNGYIVKYHRPGKGTLRFRLRVIGNQTFATGTSDLNQFGLGDNFNDIGFEAAVGYQFFINKGNRWKYYFGAELGYILNTEGGRNGRFDLVNLNTRENYFSMSICPFLGVKLKASKLLAFSLEANAVLGWIRYRQTINSQKESDFQAYRNPISIFAATLTLPHKRKEH